MKVKYNLSKQQIEILSILHFSGRTSYKIFLNIIQYDLVLLFNDSENGLKKISEQIMNLKNECAKAYSMGYTDAKTSDSFLNINYPTSKANQHYTLDLNLPHYKNPYMESNKNAHGILPNFEKEIIHLEFLGLLMLGGEKDVLSENYIDLEKKFEKDIWLTDEGILVAKRIINKRHLIYRQPPSKRRDIFVASAFGHNDLDLLYYNCIEPVCKELGFMAIRVDINEPSQTITEYIIENIANAEYIIADLSYARPSVYFEVGFAFGLGIPMLLTCRRDHFRGNQDNLKVHFDLEQFKISYWSITKDKSIEWSEGMSIKDRLKSMFETSLKLYSV